MAELTVQTATAENTLTPVFSAAASGGDTFTNDGNTAVYFKNANVSTARTITVNSLLTCSFGHDHDITITVPASSEECTGYFKTSRFNNSSGQVSMTYDNETDLTIAVIKFE